MKFNFKKIVSVLTSTIMLGSTVALAAAANYPTPFVKNGMADVAVVYGGAGANSDLVAAIDIHQSLTKELLKQAIVPSTSGVASVGTSGGDSISLAGTNSIYAYSSINTGRTSLTDNQLSNLLKGGSATDASGTKYGYTQSIVPGSTQVVFGNSQSEAIDPLTMIQIGTNPDVADSTGSGPIFNYTLSFTKSINVSDGTNVQGYATLNIMGVDYIIGASSTGADLYLYGSGTAVSVEEGENKTVKFLEKDHDVILKGTTSTTAATIIVDGVSKSVNKGSSYQFPGDFNVYIKDLFHATKTGTISSAQLLLGANTIHIVNNSQVKYGVDDTTLQNTRASITSNGNAVSKVVISQAAKDSAGDYVKVGKSFADRIFGGAKINFASLDPDLNSSTRQTITVDSDNAVAVRITADTILNQKDKQGNAITPSAIVFGRDGDGISDSALKSVNLTRDNTHKIAVIEGQNITVGDWMLVNSGDNGRILELTQIGSGTSATDTTKFKDIWTGDEFSFTTGVANGTSNTIDAATYYVATLATGGNGRSANITWGTGAAVGSIGTQTTLFPRIKLKNGGWFTILNRQNISNAVTYSIPGLDSLSTYESGTALGGGATGAENISTTLQGKVNYTISWNTTFNAAGAVTTAAATDSGYLTNISLGGGRFCELNRTAILIQEERTTIGSSSTNGDVICIPIATEGTTTTMPSIGTPVSSDNNITTLTALNSVSTKSQGLTTWGTLVESDSTGNNVVKVSYPDTQMVATVLVTAPQTTISTSDSSSTGTGATSVTQPLSVSDAEITSVSAKNLIVIGGSCVNTVAAKLLGSTSPLCGADFTSKSKAGAGQYVIETFESPYATGKFATLVAGYGAQDTTNAAKFITTQTVDTAKGKKYIGTTGTTATLEVASTGNLTGNVTG